MPRRSPSCLPGPAAPALAAVAAALWLGAAGAEPDPPVPSPDPSVRAEASVPSAPPISSVSPGLSVSPVSPVPPESTAATVMPESTAATVPPESTAATGATVAPRTVAPMRDDAVAAALWGLPEQSQRLVRGYAQLGLDVRAGAAAAAVADALRAGDRQLASLAAGGQRRVPAARLREIDMRWRALRDAAGTRPSPQIARLMDDVARQLSALVADTAAGLPPAARAARQRTLLHRMAGAHLLACWGAVPPAPAALLAMRAEFGRLLAEGADAGAGELDTATLTSQWGLLADGLDGHGAPCDAASTARVASTADRLAQLVDPPPARPFAARRP